jgi:hypothetical protein
MNNARAPVRENRILEKAGNHCTPSTSILTGVEVKPCLGPGARGVAGPGAWAPQVEIAEIATNVAIAPGLGARWVHD